MPEFEATSEYSPSLTYQRHLAVLAYSGALLLRILLNSDFFRKP